jgi:putative membrane protein
VLVGAALLGLLLYHTGLGPVLSRLQALGWRAPLILLPYALINVFDTFAWRLTLPAADRARIPFRSLYLVRMAGEAVNSLTPTATVGGEPLKAHMLRGWGVPGSHGMASVVIGKTALTVSQIAFILVGLCAFLDVRDQGAAGAGLLAVLAASAVGFTLLMVRLQSRNPVSAAWRWLRRIMPRAKFVARFEDKVQAIDARLAEFYRERPAFLAATASHFVAWLLGVVEVKLAMTLIGAPVSWEDALIVEALAQPIRAVALVIPGGLGAQEVGGVALCTALGMAEPAAVTLWLLKRGRELFFDVVGLVYLTRHTAGRVARPVRP